MKLVLIVMLACATMFPIEVGACIKQSNEQIVRSIERKVDSRTIKIVVAWGLWGSMIVLFTKMFGLQFLILFGIGLIVLFAICFIYYKVKRKK